MTTDLPSFDLGIETGDDRVVFTPRGELDLATAPELEEALVSAIEEGHEVVLDLRELEFMDSSGVRVLVVAHTRGDGRFGLIAAGPTSPVTKILAISGLEPELRFVEA
jgi:anti-anti-sigma factor